MIIWHSIFRQTIGVRCVLDPDMFFGMFFLPRDSEVMQTIFSPLGLNAPRLFDHGAVSRGSIQVRAMAAMAVPSVRFTASQILMIFRCSHEETPFTPDDARRHAVEPIRKRKWGSLLTINISFQCSFSYSMLLTTLLFSSCLFNNLEYNEFFFRLLIWVKILELCCQKVTLRIALGGCVAALVSSETKSVP